MVLSISIIFNGLLLLAVVGLYWFGLRREKKLNARLEKSREHAESMAAQRNDHWTMRGIAEGNHAAAQAGLEQLRLGVFRIAAMVATELRYFPRPEEELFDFTQFPAADQASTFRHYVFGPGVNSQAAFAKSPTIVTWPEGILACLEAVLPKLKERLATEAAVRGTYEDGMEELMKELLVISAFLNASHDGSDPDVLREAVRTARRMVDAEFARLVGTAHKRETGFGWLTPEHFQKLLTQFADPKALADSFSKHQPYRLLVTQIGMGHQGILLQHMALANVERK